MMNNHSKISRRWWYGGVACSISLLCALGLTGMVLAYPKAFAPEGMGGVNHGLLSLMMWGISAGFVHGVGFIPVHWFWRWAFSPWLAWGLMLGAGGLALDWADMLHLVFMNYEL